ncbi:MAG: thiamine-phosphate kinase [Myxococcota bacterium]|nr:thiamine-phosphate kinase [Myxococcota bacterium]
MTKRVSDLGEFGLIERIDRLARASGGREPVLGIGDDAALLRHRADEDVAVSTDAFVEGVHFRFDQEAPATAGRRAMAGALSDLAAMGARPLGVTCALAVPPNAELDPVMNLFSGLIEAARQHDAPLAGGNVTRARELSVVLTVVGAVRRGRALRRQGAKPGHRILVTGTLGGQALQRARGRVRRAPTPRLQAGQRLAADRLASACIDISDGLLADLGHLCRASGVGAEVDAEAVPRPRSLGVVARALGRAPEDWFLAGGEDYELLFTVRPGAPSCEELSGRLGLPVSEIGRITREDLVLLGAPEPPAGWRHF